MVITSRLETERLEGFHKNPCEGSIVLSGIGFKPDIKLYESPGLIRRKCSDYSINKRQ